MNRPVPGAGAVVFRGPDVLLIKRGRAPLKGHWSLPGGKIEFGETAIEAAIREVREETACEIDIIALIDVVDRIDAEAGSHFVLADYAAIWISGTPRAGDDADDARFFAPDEIAPLNLWSETVRVIEAARALVHETVRDGSGSGR